MSRCVELPPAVGRHPQVANRGGHDRLRPDLHARITRPDTEGEATSNERLAGSDHLRPVGRADLRALGQGRGAGRAQGSGERLVQVEAVGHPPGHDRKVAVPSCPAAGSFSGAASVKTGSWTNAARTLASTPACSSIRRKVNPASATRRGSRWGSAASWTGSRSTSRALLRSFWERATPVDADAEGFCVLGVAADVRVSSLWLERIEATQLVW